MSNAQASGGRPVFTVKTWADPCPVTGLVVCEERTCELHYVDAPVRLAGQAGYICKHCGGPSPIGIGYVDGSDGAGERSSGLSACGCGWSVAPGGDA